MIRQRRLVWCVFTFASARSGSTVAAQERAGLMGDLLQDVAGCLLTGFAFVLFFALATVPIARSPSESRAICSLLRSGRVQSDMPCSYSSSLRS